MHEEAEALSPALRSGNRELEIELRVREGVEARVDTLREKLRGVALSAFARSRLFRLLRCIFSEWIGWVGYRVHREGVQRRAIEIMKKSTRMKVWRAWMGWAAAKQMEERFDEIKQQVEAAGVLEDEEHEHGTMLAGAASAEDAASDPYLEAEETGRPLEGGLCLPESARAPSRGSHRIEAAELQKEIAGLRAAYTLAAAHGADGAQILLQRALSPPSQHQQQQPDAAGDFSGRSAGFALAALPPRVAAAVQPKLATMLRSAQVSLSVSLSLSLSVCLSEHHYVAGRGGKRAIGLGARGVGDYARSEQHRGAGSTDGGACRRWLSERGSRCAAAPRYISPHFFTRSGLVVFLHGLIWEPVICLSVCLPACLPVCLSVC
eukprot:COSAG03_NODE_5667_length_1198_cov_2.131028_2_plen_377_part_01